MMQSFLDYLWIWQPLELISTKLNRLEQQSSNFYYVERLASS